MVLQNLWVSQNYSRISRVSQPRFLSAYVRLAVSFFIRRCLGVSIFCKAKGLEVPIRLFVFFKLTSSRHLILNFIDSLTPVPAVTRLDLSYTSDVITFDQNWHYLYPTSAGGQDISNHTQIRVIGL